MSLTFYIFWVEVVDFVLLKMYFDQILKFLEEVIALAQMLSYDYLLQYLRQLLVEYYLLEANVSFLLKSIIILNFHRLQVLFLRYLGVVFVLIFELWFVEKAACIWHALFHHLLMLFGCNIFRDGHHKVLWWGVVIPNGKVTFDLEVDAKFVLEETW